LFYEREKEAYARLHEMQSHTEKSELVNQKEEPVPVHQEADAETSRCSFRVCEVKNMHTLLCNTMVSRLFDLICTSGIHDALHHQIEAKGTQVAGTGIWRDGHRHHSDLHKKIRMNLAFLGLIRVRQRILSKTKADPSLHQRHSEYHREVERTALSGVSKYKSTHQRHDPLRM
jgi:hypothetical protein